MKEAVKVLPKQKSDTKYRDTLIRTLFQDEKRAIELCNAVTGSEYAEDTDVQVCDLNNSLVWRYNDLAFAIDGKLLVMVEHQSTINPNLPVRFFSYLHDILHTWFIRVDELYDKGLHDIPEPEFFVLYNGSEPLQEKTLRLSDAYGGKRKSGLKKLELIVEIIDVNYTTGHEILQRSESLRGYSYLIDQIQIGLKQGLTRDQAISTAIDLCIKEDVLSDFLLKNYAEVAKMINWEYNQEAEFNAIRREAREEGMNMIVKSFLQSGMSAEDIAKYSNLSLEVVESLRSGEDD